MISDLLSDNDNTMSFASLGLSTATPSFQYQGVTYIPYLWLYNGSLTIDEELNGYLCLSTEVDAETALGSNYDPNDYLENDDVIPGWLLDNDSQPSHIISYDEAETLENPILIICYYEEGSEPDNSPDLCRKVNINHPIDADPQNKRYWVKDFNIDARHDNSKHSEVKVIYSLVINDDLKNENGISTNWGNEALIHKNDLNKWEPVSIPVLWSDVNTNGDDWKAIDQNDDVRIFAVVYEYDWWRLNRVLVHVTSNYSGSSLSVDYKLRMKSTDDVYEYLNEDDLTYLNNGDYFVGNHVKILQDL